MHRESKTARFRLGVAFVTALAAFACTAAFAGVANAGIGPLPGEPQVGLNLQRINIPYLAWRGEKVRLVKCATPEELGIVVPDGVIITQQELSVFFNNSSMFVEDWSGDQHNRPGFEQRGGLQTDVFPGTGEEVGKICFSADIVSLKAGIALVKLAVTGTEVRGGDIIILQEPFAVNPVVLLQHQFTVAWMNISSHNVSDIGPTTFPAAAPPPAVCEITIEGQCVNETLNASAGTTAAAPNQIQSIVQGTIPMEGNFDELNAQLGRTGANANQPLTMPTDWAAWAGIWARTSIQGSDRNPLLWDIHDQFTGVPGGIAAPGTDVHQTGGLCPGSSATTDEVDNCLGGNEVGAFSRFVHLFAVEVPTGVQPPGTTLADVGSFTVGPFDPKRRDTSYIPNGVLDAGDAPMPSLRVDYAIAPNAGGTDIGGVGLLVPIDKHVVYSRNGNGSSAAHNLWAPYYASFIPSTFAQRAAAPLVLQDGTINPNAGLGTTASGIDGPAKGNDFEGFVNNHGTGGLYHFWDFTFAIGRTGAAINCPPFAGGDFLNQNPALQPPAPTTPSGFRVASVYTDEHGEARVGFAPGLGFFFNALNPITNANGGCDIQGVSTLGTARISAIARYPYQPVTVPDVPGDEVVTKTVTSLFNKAVTCVPKGAGVANQVAFICTAVARGINGAPFVNERVCFISNAEAIMPAAGFTAVPPPAGLAGAALVCVLTNGSGQASVEIFGKGNLNVIANFTNEGLLRFIQLTPPTTVPLGGPPTSSNPTASSAGAVTSTATPTNSQITSVGASVTPKSPATAAKPTLLSARVVTRKGVRSLVVRVRSTKPTAKIRIEMRGKGRTVATAVRSVRTNRAVTVPKLRIARGVSRVTVSVLS